MGYRPYPQRERAGKYVRFHGAPARHIALAPFVLSDGFPSGEEERIRSVLDTLEDGVIEFVAWYPRRS